MAKLLLYHTGFHERRNPDIRAGRKNADFGQGYYLTPDRDFAERWATERRGETTFVNAYELETDGLKILELRRGEVWFDYIFQNRAGQPDSMPDCDVILGPVANDTLYDLMGMTTSGFLAKEISLQILSLGPAYTQAVVKTDRAAAQLRFLEARTLTSEEIARFRRTIRKEEEAYQLAVAQALSED